MLLSSPLPRLACVGVSLSTDQHYLYRAVLGSRDSLHLFESKEMDSHLVSGSEPTVEQHHIL